MPSIEIELLTDDENLRRLCLLYWEVSEAPNFKHKTTELTKEFGLPAHKMLAAVQQNSKAYSPDNVCPRCNKPHLFASRSDYQSKFRSKSGTMCDACIAEEREIERLRQLAEIERRQQIVREKFPLPAPKQLDFHSLSFESAVSLLAFIRLAASEGLLSYGPMVSCQRQLTPTQGMTIETVMGLFQKHCIFIHPITPQNVFTFENDDPVSMSTLYVTWALSTGNDLEQTQQMIHRLESTIKTKEWWPHTWHSQRLQLWRKVALHECLQYLEIGLTEHQLPAKFGEKTLLVLTELLERYSVGQVQNFIWRTVKDAAAFYLREKASRNYGAKQYAANTVVGSLQRQADRAHADGWDVKSYKRDRRCPQSMISQVLFDSALQIGERGFDETPALSDDLVDY